MVSYLYPPLLFSFSLKTFQQSRWKTKKKKKKKKKIDTPPIHHQALILLKLSPIHPSSSPIHHRPHRRRRSSCTIAPKLTHRRQPTHHRRPYSSSSSPIFDAQLRSSVILRRSADFAFGCVCLHMGLNLLCLPMCVCVCIWVADQRDERQASSRRTEKGERKMASFSEAPPGDPKVGEKIFKTKCAQCHTVDKGAGHKQVLREVIKL